MPALFRKPLLRLAVCHHTRPLFLEYPMVVCTLLASCRERTTLDWVLAAGIDLLTLSWIGLLIAWWL